MNTQTIWRPHEVSSAEVMTANKVILDNRLSTLREVVLALLREVESLRINEPARHAVRLYDEVQRFETELISSALSRTHGNQTAAAAILGVKLSTLNSKIKRYKISPNGCAPNEEQPLREN